MIDYSAGESTVDKQISSCEGWLRNVQLASQNLLPIFEEGAFTDLMAALMVMEQNAACGVEAFSFALPFTLSPETVNRLTALRDRCANLRWLLLGKMAGLITDDAQKNSLRLFCSAALCRLYFFDKTAEPNDAAVLTDILALLDQPVINTAPKPDASYINGLRYYVAVRQAIMDHNWKLPAHSGYFIARDNPWAVLAEYEYRSAIPKEKMRLRLFYNSRWDLRAALDSELFAVMDKHTAKRLKFLYAVEMYRYTRIWDKDIAEGIVLGLRTGVKRDMDKAVSVMLEAGRSGLLHGVYRDAVMLGYRAMAQFIIYTNNDTVFPGGNMFERFICAQQDKVQAYHFGRMAFENNQIPVGLSWLRKSATDGFHPAQEYLSQALKTTGDKAEALKWLTEHAKVSEESGVRLFNELKIKSDEASILQAVELAKELENKYSDIANWLGNYYFNQGRYDEAIPVLFTAEAQNNPDASFLLAHCRLHGYGFAVNYQAALSHLNKAGVLPFTPILRGLCAAYGLGSKPSEQRAQMCFKEREADHSKTALIHFSQGLAQAADLRQKRRVRRFWKNVWRYNDAACGLTLINRAQQSGCFRGFIEVSGLLYAAKWCKVKPKLLERTLWYINAAAQQAFIPARVLSAFLQYEAEQTETMNMPGFTLRLRAVFDRELHQRIYAHVAEDIAKRLDNCIQRFYDAYARHPAAFEPLRTVIPWMEELCVTFKGMDYFNEFIDFTNKKDYWLAADRCRKSADEGDGRAALYLFRRCPDRHKPEALTYLDIALRCNLSDAFIENAYLIENGVRNRGDAQDMYRKAIYKRNKLAVGNVRALLQGSQRQLAAFNRLIKKYMGIGG